jgi:hypothetical protein
MSARMAEAIEASNSKIQRQPRPATIALPILGASSGKRRSSGIRGKDLCAVFDREEVPHHGDCANLSYSTAEGLQEPQRDEDSQVGGHCAANGTKNIDCEADVEWALTS